MKKIVAFGFLALLVFASIVGSIDASAEEADSTTRLGQGFTIATQHDHSRNVVAFDNYVWCAWITDDRDSWCLAESDDYGVSWTKVWDNLTTQATESPGAWSLSMCVNSSGFLHVFIDDGDNIDYHNLTHFWSSTPGSVSTTPDWKRYNCLYGYIYIQTLVNSNDEIIIVGHDYDDTYQDEVACNIAVIGENKTMYREKSIFNSTRASEWTKFHSYGLAIGPNDELYLSATGRQKNSSLDLEGTIPMFAWSDDNGVSWKDLDGSALSIPLDATRFEASGVNLSMEFNNVERGAVLQPVVDSQNHIILGIWNTTGYLSTTDVNQIQFGHWNKSTGNIENKTYLNMSGWYDCMNNPGVAPYECNAIYCDANDDIHIATTAQFNAQDKYNIVLLSYYFGNSTLRMKNLTTDGDSFDYNYENAHIAFNDWPMRANHSDLILHVVYTHQIWKTEPGSNNHTVLYWRKNLDDERPYYWNQTPSSDAVVTTRTPRLSINYTDNHSAINTDKVYVGIRATNLSLTNLTSGAYASHVNISSEGVYCNLSAMGLSLDDGEVRVSVRVEDEVENIRYRVWFFNVSGPEQVAPTFSNATPANDSLNYNYVTVSINYTDASGIANSSVRVWINGTEYTVNATITNTSLSLNLSAFMTLYDGDINITVYVEDIYGNGAYYNWTIRYTTNIVIVQMEEINNLLLAIIPIIIFLGVVGVVIKKIGFERSSFGGGGW